MSRQDIFKTTKKKIIGISFGIVLVSLLTLAMLTQVFYRARLFANVDRQLLTHRNMILNEKIIKGKGEHKEVILPAPLTPDIISFVWKDGEVVDESPHVYFGEGKYPSFPSEETEGIITLDSDGYYYRGVSFIKEGLVVQLLLNVDAELQSVKQLVRATWLSLLILLLVTFGLATYLANKVLKPIRRAYDQQVFFVQDASHEMRTPLAVIKGQLELLSRHRTDQIEEHFEELAQVMNEVHALEKLNSDLLFLSKEDVGTHLNVEKIELNQFIEEISEFYEDISEIQDKRFILEKSEVLQSTWVEWDRVKVKRCLTILLENAFKYTLECGVITLKVEQENKKIKISVKDTGIGIKDEDQKRIFDRFFRSSDVRGRSIDGSGIGLSLLQSLANTMNIEIKITSEYGKGSCFTLEIPIQIKA